MDETIIIDVQFDVKEASAQLANTIKNLEDLKAEQKAINEAMRNGEGDAAKLGKRYAENAKDINELKVRQKELTSVIQLQTSQWNGYGDSLNEQRRKLLDMLKTYDSLNAELRDSEAGRTFQKQIQEQTQAVAVLEEATGRHQRSVGNYPSALSGAFPFFDKTTASLNKIGLSLDELSKNGIKAFSNLGASAKAFGKVMLTPPIALIVGVLSAIMLIFNKVTDAIKKNDEASTNLQRAYTALQPLVSGIGKIFDSLAVFVTNAILKFSQFASSVINFLSSIGLISDAYGKQQKAADELVQAEDRLQEKERQYTRDSAKRARDVEELRAKAAMLRKTDAKESARLIKQAIDLEKQDLADRKWIAQEKARILKKQARQNNDTSDAMKDKIAQADAEAYNAEKEYYTGLRKLQKGAEAGNESLNTSQRTHTKVVKEESQTRQKIYEEEVKKAKEAYEERERLRLMVEDAIIANIQDDAERARMEEETRHERTIKEFEENRSKYASFTIEYALYNRFLEEERLRHSNEMQRMASEQADAELMEEKRKQDQSDKIIRDRMDSEKRKHEETKKAFASVIYATENVLDAFGKRSRAAAVAGKAIALGEIAVNTGTAIAKGISQAQSVPFPANIAAIATTITAILTNMAQATQSVNAAHFAEGGIVGGTSYTGDRVPAMVNSREGVFTLEQQKQLFDIANNRTSVGGSYEQLTSALTEALQNMPAPIMDYKEFTQFERNVAQYNEIARL